MDCKDRIICAIHSRFPQKKVLVIGDLMVDEYVTGRVTRISPEAPVPVFNFEKRCLEAGGASNVANNVKSLGANTFIVGVASQDEAGIWLRNDLKQKGMHIEGIIAEPGRPTSIKMRFVTKGQQLLRMDNEVIKSISEKIQVEIISYLHTHIEELDAVILSDYRKGVLENESFVAKIIHICNQNNIFVSIDSKSRNIVAFENADFVKPNNLELEEAVGMKIVDEVSLDEAGKIYLGKSGAKRLIVTRGAAGISVFVPGQNRMDFAAESAQVYDVTGAGDTVISIITLGMISGLSLEESVQLANYAASVVIAKAGTVTIKPDELIRRICEK